MTGHSPRLITQPLGEDPRIQVFHRTCASQEKPWPWCCIQSVSLIIFEWQLTFQQSICHTTRYDVWDNNRREVTKRHYAQRHLSQSEDWIFCVSLATRTGNERRYALSRICRSIGRHFKRSVDTLIEPDLSSSIFTKIVMVLMLTY